MITCECDHCYKTTPHEKRSSITKINEPKDISVCVFLHVCVSVCNDVCVCMFLSVCACVCVRASKVCVLLTEM